MADGPQNLFISLAPLYEFVRKHASEDRPIQKERTPLGREYGQLVSKLTDSIDIAQGFYLWGYYDRRKFWHGVYLGKAGFKKTANLRARICEELKDEKWFLWRHVHPEQWVVDLSNAVFPGTGHERDCRRALLKAGSSHIVWAPASWIDADSIRPIEADLIEAVNPKVNQIRSTPPETVQADASKIFESFRQSIHAARKTAFNSGLFGVES